MKDKKKAYVIGRQSLVDEISLTHVDVVPSHIHNNMYGMFTYESHIDIPFDDIDVVIVGYDDNINFYKLTLASYAIQKGVKTYNTYRQSFSRPMLIRTLNHLHTAI